MALYKPASYGTELCAEIKDAVDIIQHIPAFKSVNKKLYCLALRVVRNFALKLKTLWTTYNKVLLYKRVNETFYGSASSWASTG